MSFSDEQDDRRLRQVFHDAPLPLAPIDLAERLRQRLRRRRALRLAGASAAAALLLGLSLSWSRWFAQPKTPPKQPTPPPRAEAFPFAPPVDSLSVLTRDLSALEQLGEEPKP